MQPLADQFVAMYGQVALCVVGFTFVLACFQAMR